MENKKEYFVTLDDGTKVPVTAEVYSEYYQPEWREHKLGQRDRKRLLSMDYEYGSDSEGANVSMKNFRVGSNPTLEEAMINKEDFLILSKALAMLAEDSRKLIEALYMVEKTEREYVEETGIPRTTINYKRKKALEQIKAYIEKNL